MLKKFVERSLPEAFDKEWEPDCEKTFVNTTFSKMAKKIENRIDKLSVKIGETYLNTLRLITEIKNEKG